MKLKKLGPRSVWKRRPNRAEKKEYQESVTRWKETNGRTIVGKGYRRASKERNSETMRSGALIFEACGSSLSLSSSNLLRPGRLVRQIAIANSFVNY